MIRRPPRSTQSRSSAASDVYKRQLRGCVMGEGSFTGFPKGVIEFLEELKEHNDKVWFDAHRAEYEEFYLQPGRAFTADLADRLTQAGALGEGNRVEGS